MAVKVMIRRTVDGEFAEKLQHYLGALEQWASKHTGYFYGESLENPNQPGEYLSIGTWQSLEAFRSYAHSTTVQKLERQMVSAFGMSSESSIYVRQQPALP